MLLLINEILFIFRIAFMIYSYLLSQVVFSFTPILNSAFATVHINFGSLTYLALTQETPLGLTLQFRLQPLGGDIFTK